MSDLGNQHNNGPNQDHIFHNPSHFCSLLSILGQKLDSALGWTDAPNTGNGLVIKGVGLFLLFYIFIFFINVCFFYLLDLLLNVK